MKKKNPFLTTYLAVALLAGLGAYAWFVERKKPADDEKPKQKVFTLDKTKVKEVALSHGSDPGVTLVRMDKAWRLSAPTPADADTEAVDALLTTLEGLEVQDVISEQGAALADFGLDTPKAKATLTVEGSPKPLELLLGGKVPAEPTVYAKTPDSPRVFTVPSTAEATLTRKPFEFRDRSVLHVKRADVKTLDVTGPEGSYSLNREGEMEWSFTKPIATRAGRFAVDGLVGNLESLRMEEVAAEQATDVKPYGLDAPTRTVTLGLADGTKRTLEIGSLAGGEKRWHARAAGSPLVAVIPGAIVDDLAKGMGELRAKRLLDVSVYDVTNIDVEAADAAKKSFTRSSTKDPKEGFDVYHWKRSDAQDVPTQKVQDALFLIGGLEVAAFVDQPAGPDSYGLDKPVLKVSLRTAEAKEPAWFEIGKKGDSAYARRSGDSAVLQLDAKKTDDLVKAFREL